MDNEETFNCPECSAELYVITKTIRLLQDKVAELELYLSTLHVHEEHESDRDREEYYIASARETRKTFHRPNCEWAEYLKPHWCPTFNSRKEAIDEGYKPCKTCCS
ncbi:MAG: hypothetical protein ISS16_04410 [Ignavibacteria bacterium]|nr:hypothetical protein [Bacteroidota bacterium]MBL7128209.1 hypothetical protein [Ignavibacteria bacterium]